MCLLGQEFLSGFAWKHLYSMFLHVHMQFFYSHFAPTPLSKGIRIFFSFLFFLSWIFHKAPLKRCWRILKGVALVSSLFFFPLFGALSKIKLIYICLVCGAKYAYRIQYLYILFFFFFLRSLCFQEMLPLQATKCICLLSNLN